MIGIYPDDEEPIDIELYIINHRRVLTAKYNLRYVRDAIKYYADTEGDQKTVDAIESTEKYFKEMVQEYTRLVVRDV